MRTHRFVGAVVVLGAAFALASAGLAIAQEGVTRTVILKKPLEGGSALGAPAAPGAPPQWRR